MRGSTPASACVLGFNVWEVVREYGLLQECILEYAARHGVAILPEEQVMLARWISRRMADAISQYVHERDAEREREASRHLGFIAHELRTPLYAARLAFERLRAQELAGGGRPVEVLDRSLRRTSQLIEETLTRSSLRLGLEPNLEPIDLPSFLGDLERDTAIEGQARNVAVDITAPPWADGGRGPEIAAFGGCQPRLERGEVQPAGYAGANRRRADGDRRVNRRR